ncbi:MAG: BrnA antitoxin family protein [Treponema sp.]|nr:BrnA antitoxin family protein [Treponema sp.]
MKPVIALRITPETLAKFKSLGKGYTGVMASVLDYAANNPEMIAKVQ